jgi:flagellar biosynthesis chaperone FliJ
MAKSPRGNSVEHRMCRALDELAEFEKFQDEILPELRADLKRGMSAEQIYAKYQAVVAARSVTIAVKEADSGKALTAAKDILDRCQGKAKERQEVEHKLSRLKDEELDSLIMSEMANVDEGDLAN